jgi:cytoskeletal protein CcmA (bactofilin family)
MLPPMKLIILSISLFLSAFSCRAFEFIAATNYLLKTEQTVDDELWVSAMATGAVHGTLEQDLFIMAGQHLELAGSFDGDVWAMSGKTAALTGAAMHNVRMAAQTVQIDTAIGGNLMAAAEILSISTNSFITGDQLLVGTRVVLEGHSKGDVLIYAATLATISGTIDGTLKVNALEIIIQPGTKIGGDLIYTSPQELIIDPAIVDGTIERTMESLSTPSPLSLKRIMIHLQWMLAATLVGIALLYLFPLTTSIASRQARIIPLKCLLTGLATLIALPLLAIICCSTRIGLPLGIILFAAWGILFYLARVIVAFTIGSLLLRNRPPSRQNALSILAAGMGIVYLALILPGFNLGANLIIASVGMGALVSSIHQKRKMIIHLPQELQEQLERAKEERAAENHEE